jgi:hypothetical protein
VTLGGSQVNYAYLYLSYLPIWKKRFLVCWITYTFMHGFVCAWSMVSDTTNFNVVEVRWLLGLYLKWKRQTWQQSTDEVSLLVCVPTSMNFQITLYGYWNSLIVHSSIHWDKCFLHVSAYPPFELMTETDPVSETSCSFLECYNMDLFVCLFSWRYNPLWLYFPQPGSGL